MIPFKSDQGEISVSSAVFSSITGMAATNCFGVKGMAGKNKEGIFQLLKRESMSKGVVVRFGSENEMMIELHIAIDQGVNITTICREIMKEVSYKVASATGIPVSRVDIYVDTMILG